MVSEVGKKILVAIFSKNISTKRLLLMPHIFFYKLFKEKIVPPTRYHADFRLSVNMLNHIFLKSKFYCNPETISLSYKFTKVMWVEKVGEEI